MLRPLMGITLFLFLSIGAVTARSEGAVSFGGSEYRVVEVAVAKSSSARQAELREGSLGLLQKYIYLPAGTVLFLLEHVQRDRKSGRTYRLAISEYGMPLYVLPGSNYFPKQRFVGISGEYAAIPREKVVLMTRTYGEITLTPSEVYRMEFRESPMVAITIGRDKMMDLFTRNEVVEVSEDRFAVVTLPIEDGVRMPQPTRIYDIESALEDLLNAVSHEDQEKLEKFETYMLGKFVSQKECEDVIEYGLTLDAGLAAEFDSWLSPIAVKLSLSGAYKATRKHDKGIAFRIERYDVDGAIYELKDEGVAKDCVNLEDNRRIRIASGPTIADLNTKDAQDLGLRKDPKGRIVYTCRDEYLKIETTLNEQALPVGPARLMIARFTTYEGFGDAAACAPVQ